MGLTKRDVWPRAGARPEAGAGEEDVAEAAARGAEVC